MFNIKCYIYRNKAQKYELRFNVKSSDKFLNLIKPIFIKYNIPKNMWYKLGHLWEGNTQKIEITRKKKAVRSKQWRRDNTEKIKKEAQKYYLKHQEYLKFSFKDRRKRLKDKGLCTRCAKNSHYRTLSICYDCKEKQRLYAIERRLKLKENKICTSCGVRKSVSDVTKCYICVQKRHMRYIKQKRRLNYAKR